MNERVEQAKEFAVFSDIFNKQTAKLEAFIERKTRTNKIIHWVR